MRLVVVFAIALLELLQLTTSAETSQVQTALTNVPSVKLHVTLKRKTMKLHGTTEFDIYASPVIFAYDTSLRYDSYATFVDKQSEYIYTLYDGAAYVTTVDDNNVKTVRCLSPSALPARTDVTPISSASIGKGFAECASGILFKTSFLSVQYAICGSGEAGFTAFSGDLDISLEYLHEPVSILKPELTNGSDSCGPLEKAMSMTSTAVASVTGAKIPSSASRILKAESHMVMQATECTHTSTPRPCIFFHGSGNLKEETGLKDRPVFDTKRLGDMHDHAPFCSSIKYAVMDTTSFGWTDDTLQQKYCNHSLSMSYKSDDVTGTIENTIIVTHSMAGLVMAGALATGKCKFSSTTSWVSLSPPMAGTMASDYLAKVCNSSESLAEDLFELIGHCPVSTARTSMFREGGDYIDPPLAEAYKAAREAYRGNVTAAMCSDSFVGLVSSYAPRCVAAGILMHHKTLENDGLVEFESCLGGLDASKFGTHYTNQFYRPQLNHADTAFLTGEGMKDSKKPITWFECLAL